MSVNVYAVTAEWEDRRKGRCRRDLADLANTPAEAEMCARSGVSENGGVDQESITARAHGLWDGSINARVVAELGFDRAGAVAWRETR